MSSTDSGTNDKKENTSSNEKNFLQFPPTGGLVAARCEVLGFCRSRARDFGRAYRHRRCGRNRSRGDGGARRATLTLTITHLEKQKVVFGIEKIAVDGEWSMKFHFPDAGEYRVAAVGNVPGLAPVRSEHGMTVTGMEPPAGTMIAALVYFVGLIALGLGAGRWSKKRGPSI